MMTSPSPQKPTMKSSSKSHSDFALVKKRKERDGLEKVEAIPSAKAPRVEVGEGLDEEKTLSPKVSELSHAAEVPKGAEKCLPLSKKP